MNNKLTQDYKDDLYEKVLEKKAKRTVKRKRLASICAIFIIVACLAGYGYTKYEKENYNNYFVTETDNIYIDDEYEYFDDLGIKLEFINTDKDSITIGVNIKYEDIADCIIAFNEIKLDDGKNKMSYKNDISVSDGIKNVSHTYKVLENNELLCIINIEKNNDTRKIKKDFNLSLKQILVESRKDKSIKIIDVDFNKKISIED